ncbi:MAG: formate dehydrogenase accessory sulfurtransferase FdhD [Eggerthellaceae bacterium]|jgi:FdhD protein|nr:formate dehydrogenase accessory sulfurtransferase FdhD [Eggerthellaceae bacterium]
MNVSGLVLSAKGFSKANSYVTLPIGRFKDGDVSDSHGEIIQEVEMNVVVNGRYVHTLTCSPWDIDELAVGYLFLKGAITDASQIDSMYVDGQNGLVSVLLKHQIAIQDKDRIIPFEPAGFRTAKKKPHFRDSSELPDVVSSLLLSASQVNAMAAMLDHDSLLFKQTGGTHSAALIDDNSVVAWFEDIGRHSAVDKLVGWCVLNDYDVRDSVLLFSGRVPYEIIIKAIKAAYPVIISPGAPTNLSIELADKHGVTLIGFAKEGCFNIYSHPERVTAP